MGHGEASPPATNTFCDCQVTAPTLEEKEGRGRTRAGGKCHSSLSWWKLIHLRARSCSFPEDAVSVGIKVSRFTKQSSAGAVRYPLLWLPLKQDEEGHMSRAYPGQTHLLTHIMHSRKGTGNLLAPLPCSQSWFLKASDSSLSNNEVACFG